MADADDHRHRRTRLIVIGSLVFAVVVAVGGFLYVRRTGQHLRRKRSDASLCASAASTLELVNPNMAAGVPALGLTTSRTTAGQVAAQIGRAGSSPHPWDQEAGGAVVIRCQSGNVIWVVDAEGHAARLPPP